MSENREQGKRKTGHETKKQKDRGPVDFHTEDPPGLSEPPGLA